MAEIRRLAAVMSTGAAGNIPDTAQNEIRALITERVEQKGGQMLKPSGGAMLAEFPSSIAALEAALAIQRLLRERSRNRPEDEKIFLRIGIHLGDLLLREGDVLGDAAQLASRLEPMAEPGGICVSRMVFDTARRMLKLNAVSLGARDIMGAGEGMEVFKILLDEDDEGRHAEEDITRHDDPRMRTVVVPFWGSTPEENAEGKKMGALVVRALEKELGGQDMQIVFDEGAAVKTNAEALAFGKSRKADAVVWGEVMSLYGEVEIQPRLTWTKNTHFSSAQVGALTANTQEKGQIALRRAKAAEVAGAALYMAALHHRALGNLEPSVALFRKFIAQEGENPHPSFAADLAAAYGRVCWCYWLQHRIGEALAMAQEGVQRFPRHAGLRAHLGACLLRLGRTEEGLREFEEACRLEPEDPQTRVRLAFGYLQLDRVVEAVSLAEDAVRQMPLSSYARAHLAMAYMASGRIEDAFMEFKEAVRLEPENHEHRRFLGVAFLAANTVRAVREEFHRRDFHLKEAERAFAEACRLAPMDRYNQLMFRAARWLQGSTDAFSRDSIAQVFPRPAAGTAAPWPEPVYLFLGGMTSEDEMMRCAEESPEELRRRSARTEANFYAALTRFHAADAEGMLARLRACEPLNMYEDMAARGIVRRLSPVK